MRDVPSRQNCERHGQRFVNNAPADTIMPYIRDDPAVALKERESISIGCQEDGSGPTWDLRSSEHEAAWPQQHCAFSEW